MEQKIQVNLEVAEQSGKVMKWRLVAVCAVFVWSAIFLLTFVVFKNYTSHFESLFPRLLLAVFLIFSVVGSVFLVVFPLQFYVHAFFCCMWGILHFMTGENLLGFVGYFSGIGFCYYQGFFRRALRRKLAVFIAILFAVFAWHLYRKNISWESAVIRFLEIALLAYMISSLFLSLFYKNAFRTGEKVLCLSPQKFSNQEAALLRLILSDDKYQAIATKQNISRSSVKARAREIYKKLGVNDYHDCLTRWQGWAVEFDK